MSRPAVRRLIVVLVLAAALAAGLAMTFTGTDGAAVVRAVPVTDEATFAQAVEQAAPGDTIELADGVYPELTVGGKNGITITGGRGARLDGLVIEGSSDVTVEGVSITPSGDRRAEIRLAESTSGVTIAGVLVDGRDETVGAGISADETVSDVTLVGSELTNCGDGERCVAVDFTTGVVIQGNTFHDCLSCDFIRGRSGMTIRGNTFERAIPGRCEEEGGDCAHNDIIQVMGGGPWSIVGNRFGDAEGGGGAVFVSLGRGNEDNPIHDVTIASNVFAGSVRHFAVNVTGDEAAPAGLISGISIVNNTILSGNTAAISLSPAWATLPESERPLVANNVFGRLRNKDLCARGRFVSNVAVTGSTCAGVKRGRTALDETGAPTSASKALLDRADRRYAPKRDYYGKTRNGAPDIGAIEYRG